MNEGITFDEYLLFNIGDAQYVAWPHHHDHQDIPLAQEEFPQNRTLITVIPVPSSSSSSPGTEKRKRRRERSRSVGEGGGRLVTKEYLVMFVEDALRTDDVYRLEFLSGIVFHGHGGLPGDDDDDDDEHHLLEPNALDLLKNSWKNIWFTYVEGTTTTQSLLPGPYILEKGTLRQVWRIYDDWVNAFVITFRPSSSDDSSNRGLVCTYLSYRKISRKKPPFPSQRVPNTYVHSLHTADQRERDVTGVSFLPLRISGGTGTHRSVAVPSRLRAAKGSPPPPSSSSSPSRRPLDGIRITVKDMFQIRGFRTSLCSRAYLELYPPASHTAPAIEKLIDRGAQLVGTSQLCSMVGTQEPTQCVDFQDPFNPRGDGYQSPSGGSSGQPAAIAAYDWLDIAIGSDATISGRMPAQANGCFSLRPTGGAISREGMWSAVPQFDTPCFFGRDLRKFSHFARAWYAEGLQSPARLLPRTIIYFSDFLPVDNAAQMHIFNGMVKDLESSLGGVHAKQICISQLWDMKPPKDTGGKKLTEYLNPDIAIRTYVYMFWKKIEVFWIDYQKRFNKTPFLPPPKGIHLWDAARDINPSQHEAALRHLAVYKQWLLEEVLQVEVQNAVVMLPLGNVKPNYRDDWPGEKVGGQKLWEPLLLAPILGAPEIVIPAGELHYESRISGREESLPVCVSIMGLPGSDLDLIDLALNCLIQAGRPTEVSTGNTMFKSKS